MDNIDWKDYLFSFEGRINRAKWWLGTVILWFVPMAILMVVVLTESSFLYWLAMVALLALIWPWLAITIKRWHDRGKSGWWILIGLVPFIGGIWALIETGFLAGTPGPNEYGLDPLIEV